MRGAKPMNTTMAQCGLRSMAASLLLVLLGACASRPGVPHPELACPPQRSYQVVNHGSHLGLVVPAGDLIREVPGLAPEFGTARFLEIGWGDAFYYPEPEPGWFAGLRALFWPTDSVLHVAGLADDPRETFVNLEIIELQVADAGYRQLIAFFAQAFALSPEGEPVATGPGQYGHSLFYRAHGTYHLFRTCNTWTAQAIAVSGLPVRSRGVIGAEAVMKQIRDGFHSCPAGPGSATVTGNPSR
jgi:uncharacterized protein (TIGR02117 family)